MYSASMCSQADEMGSFPTYQCEHYVVEEDVNTVIEMLQRHCTTHMLCYMFAQTHKMPARPLAAMKEQNVLELSV